MHAMLGRKLADRQPVDPRVRSVEDLAAHLAGRERDKADARWNELLPAYRALAANVD